MSRRFFDDRQIVFGADQIGKFSGGHAGSLEIAEFPCTVQGSGVPDDMIVDMVFIHMGCHDKCVVSFEPAFCKFITDPVCFLWCDFTGFERLPVLIGDHIAFLFSAGDVFILPLGKQELCICSFWITSIAGDPFSLVGFLWILCVRRSVI